MKLKEYCNDYLKWYDEKNEQLQARYSEIEKGLEVKNLETDFSKYTFDEPFLYKKMYDSFFKVYKPIYEKIHNSETKTDKLNVISLKECVENSIFIKEKKSEEIKDSIEKYKSFILDQIDFYNNEIKKHEKKSRIGKIFEKSYLSNQINSLNKELSRISNVILSDYNLFFGKFDCLEKLTDGIKAYETLFDDDGLLLGLTEEETEQRIRRIVNYLLNKGLTLNAVEEDKQTLNSLKLRCEQLENSIPAQKESENKVVESLKKGAGLISKRLGGSVKKYKQIKDETVKETSDNEQKTGVDTKLKINLKKIADAAVNPVYEEELDPKKEIDLIKQNISRLENGFKAIDENFLYFYEKKYELFKKIFIEQLNILDSEIQTAKQRQQQEQEQQQEYERIQELKKTGLEELKEFIEKLKKKIDDLEKFISNKKLSKELIDYIDYLITNISNKKDFIQKEDSEELTRLSKSYSKYYSIAEEYELLEDDILESYFSKSKKALEELV